MFPWKKIGMTAAAAAILVGGGLNHDSLAATKKRSAGASTKKMPPTEGHISSDPGSATIKEAALLKWGAVDPPSKGKHDQFFFRGAFLEATPVEGQKNVYSLKFLPIAILENEERSITIDNYTNGVSVEREVADQKWLKSFKKGNIAEVRQYYEEAKEGGIGHAQMMVYTFHQDIVPYPVAAQSYVKTPGLEMEQYMNAMKSIELSDDKGGGDNLFKDALDSLASSAPSPEVKAKATELLASIFSAKPSGKPMMKGSPIGGMPESTPPPGTKTKKK